jgi:L-lactate dehydrogenase (cytochrome)
LNRPVCIEDYRLLARRRLPKVLFDYVDGGAYDEITLARNTADLRALRLRQRIMRDVSSINLKTEVLGQALAFPVILGPVGAAGLYARRGEAQAARVAAGAGIAACLSTVSVCDIAETADAAGAPPWFQLYMLRDRPFMEVLLQKAREVGCPVLVFTVDLPVAGTRYRSARTSMGGALPMAGRLREMADILTKPSWLWDVWLRGRPHHFGNVAAAVPGAAGSRDFFGWLGANFEPAITWDDIAWLRARWDRPIVLKGVLDSEDARTAVSLGIDGLVVSNHGGRQLDGVPSSIQALGPIVDAVGDRTTVLMDGGIRSGLDVVKALALGAKACLIGRAWAYPLAARGGEGVAHALGLLRQEMLVAMALTGCVDVRDAGPHMLAYPAANSATIG